MSAERGHGSKSRVHFLGYSLIPRVGHGVGQAVDPHFDPHHFLRFCNKKAPKTEVFDAFGAGGVTRTHDLLITKCIGALRLAVFRAFGAFPLGILREVRPILSIVFVRSFPRVGHGVGQSAFRTQTKGAPPTAVTLTSALCPAHR